jgi:hypothetical protein
LFEIGIMMIAVHLPSATFVAFMKTVPVRSVEPFRAE